MTLSTRLKGKAIAAWLGTPGDTARRAVADLRQRLSSTPRRLDLYFDVADPWSYLAAQVVERLVNAYDVELGFHVVTAPASDVDAAPALRARHAVRDAQALVDYWDLDFPGRKEADPGPVREVATALIRERPAAEQLRAALELGQAMWAGDRPALARLLGKWGTEAHGAVAPILNANYAALRKAGHYQAGMIAYGGSWYHALDRLTHLEAHLARDRERAVAGVVAPRPEEARGPRPLAEKAGAELEVEMWFSFRSPFSYLALEQIEAIVAPSGLPLVLRPILPMVTRGLKMPMGKQLYLVRDAKREADRLGIPFGAICDPLGAGVTNCIALAHFAAARGRLLPFARSATRGIWSEALDMTAYVDLRQVVERAELPWDEAREALDDPEAARVATANAADLAVIGLWGVPSFRVGDLVLWGQDRLPLLADRLRRHAAA